MKLLIMKLLSNLKKALHTLILASLVITPLAIQVPTALAADQPTVEFSQAELDQMLAPIALYPDALLSQVLIAATYPLEIIQADRWVRSNKDLKTEDALKFAENKDWDPSVKALVAFPDILKRMSEDVDWTQRLGDAFLGNEESVMDAVQRLRKRAYAAGNLDKAQHITVARDDNNITIEPAEERIVYVPVYDTRVVYGNWWWADYPPVYWYASNNYTYASGFYWGTSIYLGPTYFYSSCQWRDRRVVVIDRHTHFDNGARFYTGRSIVSYRDAREWHHDPDHRRGVAYYNNNLRETYGSRHESYENDRVYRDNHRDVERSRDTSLSNQNPRINRDWNHNDDNRNEHSNDRDRNNNNQNERNDNNASHHFDHSEQVRERLSPHNQQTTVRNSDNNSPIQPVAPRENSPSFNVPHTEESESNRAMIMQHRQTETSVNVNDNNRVDQERRVVTDGAEHRPNFSVPVERNNEQRVNIPNPQPHVEQREDSPRRAEFSPPRNEAEGRAQQQQRTERANNPRFNREKKDDDNK